MIFPLSWSGTQYVVFEGKPGTRYQIPFSLRKLQPLLPMKPSATTSKTASLLVKMKHGSLKQSVSTSLQATRSSLPALSLEEWTFKTKAAAAQAKRYLERSAAVDYVEHTQTVRTAKDMYRPYQWSLQNTGQRKGKLGADIQYAGAMKTPRREDITVDTRRRRRYRDQLDLCRFRRTRPDRSWIRLHPREDFRHRSGRSRFPCRRDHCCECR